MIYSNENEDVRKIFVECDCGCGAITISQWKDDGIVCIGYSEDAFGSHQQPVRTATKKYLKRLWCALLGKDYLFFDVSIINKKTITDLKEAILSLDERKLEY
jgi:hypothetical protein